jgi:glucose/arabinose dehydrogenase
MKITASLRSLALAALAGVAGAPLYAQFDPNNPIPAVIPHGPVRVDLRTVASNLVAPNLLISSPDGTGRRFIVDQPGQIWIVKDNKVLPTPFLDVASRLVPLMTGFDERGLLGLAFDPGFNNPQSPGHRRIFTYSSEPVSGTADLADPYITTTINCHGVVASWKVSEADPDVVDPATRVEILRIDKPQFNHNGGTVDFGPDGLLYIGFGDGGGANDNNPNGHNPTIGNGQDVNIALGKMIRIDVNGTDSANGKYGIPPTNPFAAGGGVREIFAIGLRNPFRFSFDGNDLLVADVGQNDIEELDRVELGKNYGWRLKEGTFKFNTDGTVSDDLTWLPPGLTDPILQYDHDEGISIIGGYVYRGNAIPELQGKYVFGDFSKAFVPPSGRLFYADLATGEIREFILGSNDAPLGLYIKGMGIDADGEIYVAASVVLGPTKNPQGIATGVVLKLVPPAVGFATGGPVPFAGVEGSGVPEGSTFKSFGAPSLNDSAEIAFAALLTSSEGKQTAILGPKPSDRTTFGPIAVQGGPAADETGAPLPNSAAFASFGDPVLNAEGSVAFTGKLKTKPKIRGSQDTGLWSSVGGKLHLVAREGSEAPGATGATFKKFTSIALGSSEGDATLAFVASLGRTSAGTDAGLWFAQETAAPALVLREGQTLSVSGTDRRIRSLRALTILPGAPGQGNGVADAAVMAHATFTDGTQAVLRARSALDVAVVAATGDAQLGALLRSFSSITQGGGNARAAFIASLQNATTTTNAAVFTEEDDASLAAVARKGDPAPDTDATFSEFGTVVRRSDGDALLQATIKGGTATKSTNTGLWWQRIGVLSLLAREGSPSPLNGAPWHSFQSIALPDGADDGPLFVGTLRPGGLFTARNNVGLWATDAEGDLHLVLRTGDEIELGAESKTLRSFTVLSTVPGSPAQTRSYNNVRHVVFRAQLTDGTQAIQTRPLP